MCARPKAFYLFLALEFELFYLIKLFFYVSCFQKAKNEENHCKQIEKNKHEPTSQTIVCGLALHMDSEGA